MSLRPPAACFARVFGLDLEVSRPLAGLDLVSTPRAVDVRVRFDDWPRELRSITTPDAPPSHVSPFADVAGAPLARGWDLPGGSRHLILHTGHEALINKAGNEVWIAGRAEPEDDVDAWVLGPVLALVLRRRGTVCLHAAVVSTPDGAVALAGSQGAGKSTLAIACVMRGCAAVTDDLAALDAADPDGPVRVHPGAAYLRARRGLVEAMAAQLGRADDLTASPDHRHLDLDARLPPYARASRPVPLCGVCVLDGQPSEDAGLLEPLRGADAVMALAGDTWAARWLSAAERAAEFEVLARLVRDVPLWRARRPASVAALLSIADEIANRRGAFRA